jgi:hypothetical protein
MHPATLTGERPDTWSDNGVTDVGGTSHRPLTVRVTDWARDNRLFCAALVIAAALRVVVAIAYAPALEFFADSYAYLNSARHPFRVDIWHPLGYPLLVWLVSLGRDVAVLTLVQHVLGLATGLLVYRLVRTLGVGAVGGTIAAAPLLFDAYQVNVEQFVLSETFFTFLVVTSMVTTVRLLRTRTTAAAVGCGALLAVASLTRTVGIVVAGVVVLVVLLGRVGWTRAAALAATCAAPIGAYALAFHASYGVFALQGYGGRYLYGIVAPFADCRPSALPAEQRSLCPTLPAYARPGSNQYVWNEYSAAHMPGNDIQKSEIAGNFARTIVTHQPGQVARATLGNVLHYFEPGRSVGPRDWYVGSWQFPTAQAAPAWNIQPATAGFRPGDRVHGRIVAGLADVLRGYQRVVFTPGPLLLASLVVAGIACCLRRRDGHRRLATALLGGTGLALLALPAVSAGFDWRYLLPAQAVLVPAGVIAVALLRPTAQRWLHRWTPVVAAALVCTLAAPGLADSSIYASSALKPSARGQVPATLSIRGHATVEVGRGSLLGALCARTDEGRRELLGLVAFPAAVRYTSGPPMLVQMANFGLSNGNLTVPGIRPKGDVLRGVVLSRRYPATRGTVYAYVRSPSGVLRYVDPYGGGAASWTFRLPPPSPGTRLGSPCTGSTPWAGRQLPYLRVTTPPAFTALDQQLVTYGLHWQQWRADSYDLRFRVASPTRDPGPWQYPRSWQRSTVTEQSLIDLSPGVTYCFSVRARDNLDAVTDWSLPKCMARLYDDTALPPTPGWTTVREQPGFLNGTYTATRAQNASFTVSGTFSRVGVSAYRCPDCGVLDVYVGTRLVRSLDLRSSAASAGLWQWTSGPFTEAATTLTLKVRSQNRLVVLDGFGMLR